MVQQLKAEAASQQALSETQCKRLSDRQKVSDAKIRQLKSQLTDLTIQQQREQKDQAQLVSEMASTIRVSSWSINITTFINDAYFAKRLTTRECMMQILI